MFPHHTEQIMHVSPHKRHEGHFYGQVSKTEHEHLIEVLHDIKISERMTQGKLFLCLGSINY